jgi:hypothetical protein
MVTVSWPLTGAATSVEWHEVLHRALAECALSEIVARW